MKKRTESLIGIEFKWNLVFKNAVFSYTCDFIMLGNDTVHLIYIKYKLMKEPKKTM